MKRLPFTLAVIVTSSFVAGLAANLRATATKPEIAEILDKVGSYLADYEQRFAAIVAEEHYAQAVHTISAPPSSHGNFMSGATERRNLVSDVIMLTLGQNRWVAFRDVLAVDGQPIRNRAQRFKALFTNTTGDALAQSEEIMAEGARYNIGPVQRNVNVPTMALSYLRLQNQPRSSFRVEGAETWGGRQTVVLAFTESARPTIIRSESGDMFATGRFWIEPQTGRVVKSDLVLKSKTTKSDITVTYAPAEGFDLWPPSTMREEYDVGGGESIFGDATYTNPRQFSVSAKPIIK